MLNRVYGRILAAAGLLLITTTCSATVANQASGSGDLSSRTRALTDPTPIGRLVTTIPLVYDGSHSTIPLSIASHPPMQFAIDLGSPATILVPQIIKQLGRNVQIIGQSTASGLGGTISMQQARVDSMRIGSVFVPSLNVLVIDLLASDTTKSAEIRRKYSGIIGVNFLGAYDLGYDIPDGQLRLYEPSTPPGRMVSTVGTDTSGPAFDLRKRLRPRYTCVPNIGKGSYLVFNVLLNGHPVHALFDTGSRFSILSWEAAALLDLTRTSPRLIRHDGSGIGGPIESYRMKADGIRMVMAGITLTSDTVQVSSLPDIPHSGEHLPLIFIGIRDVQDRPFVVSYSTNQVCLGTRHDADS